MSQTPNDKSPEGHAQSGEDLLVWEYFQRKTDGFFVEVGANDPTVLSQTWFLEQKGWRGILIEPQSACCQRLRQMRPRAVVYQVACGSRESSGRALLRLAREDVYASLVQTSANEDIDYCGTEEVQVVALDDLLEKERNPTIDYVSIDVEGAEIEVLRGFDLRRHRPRLMVVEDHLHHLRVHRHLLGQGYRLVKRTGCNNWYVPRGERFPHSTFGERLQLFRKVWLGTPFRAWRHRRRSAAGASPSAH